MNLKWTSPAATMFERIQDYQLQQEHQLRQALNMFQDFEFRAPFGRGIEKHFDPWMLRENDLEIKKEEAQGENNKTTAENISELFKS